MTTDRLIIPQKLKVGFNKRGDTYTGQLAFVIYFDDKGVLRKERSWESWRDKKIDAVEYPNEPLDGFVLNRKAGGGSGWSHHVRQTTVRVWDPRNFEVEISVPNLLFILREGTCHPGKGLDGKFVYAWDNKELVLLPVSSEDYRASLGYTAAQATSVKVRELKPGHTYRTKKLEEWVFLGKLDYLYSPGSHRWGQKPKENDPGVEKRLVFAELTDGEWSVIYEENSKALSSVISTETPDNFAELMELHTKSIRGSKVVRLFLKSVPNTGESSYRKYWWKAMEDGSFAKMETNYKEAERITPTHTNMGCQLLTENGTVNRKGERYSATLYSYHSSYREYSNSYYARLNGQPVSPNPWTDPEDNALFALLECGAEVQVNEYSFDKG